MQPTKAQIRFWSSVKKAASLKLISNYQVRLYRFDWHHRTDDYLSNETSALLWKCYVKVTQDSLKRELRHKQGKRVVQRELVSP